MRGSEPLRLVAETSDALTSGNDEEGQPVDETAKKWIYWTIPIVVVIGLGVALYYGRKQQAPEVEPVVQQEPAAEIAPPIQHPIEADEVEPLPTLPESDPEVSASLREVLGQPLDQFLVPDSIVRHLVVTIDNLPRKKTAPQLRPVKPVPGELVISGNGDKTVLNPENAKRYAPMVKLVASADAAKIASVYRRFYPLFQEAYVDLGYPQGYFNDRLVEVIDHLLATPEVEGPIRLRRPGMFYEYADPSIEALSSGQKLLIRMGSDNAATVKEKLRALRTEVTKEMDTPQ